MIHLPAVGAGDGRAGAADTYCRDLLAIGNADDRTPLRSLVVEPPQRDVTLADLTDDELALAFFEIRQTVGCAASGIEGDHPALPDVDFHAGDGTALMDRQKAHLQQYNAPIGGPDRDEVAEHRAGGRENGRAHQRRRTLLELTRAGGAIEEGDFTGGLDRVDIAGKLVAADRLTLHRRLGGAVAQPKRPTEADRRRAKERNRFRTDEDQDPDHAQDHPDPAERDDCDGRAIDAFEPFDAAGGSRHLPPDSGLAGQGRGKRLPGCGHTHGMVRRERISSWKRRPPAPPP